MDAHDSNALLTFLSGLSVLVSLAVLAHSFYREHRQKRIDAATQRELRRTASLVQREAEHTRKLIREVAVTAAPKGRMGFH